MNKEFNKISNKEETRYVLETASGGSSSAGSIASVSMPVGGTSIQRRPGDNLLTPESDTVKQKPRQGPLRTQTGGGKHKDKTKTIPRKAKYKDPVAETYQTQLETILNQKKDITESLRPGEYHIWTVHFDDGTKGRIRISNEETTDDQIKSYYAKKGKNVVKVDYNWSINGGGHITPPEPQEPGGPGNRVNAYGEPMKESDVLEAIPGGNDTINFMHDTVGIPKDEVGYAVMLLRKKQTGKTLSPREEADWVVYEKKLRIALMVRKNQSVAEGQDLDMDMIARRLEPGMQTDDEVIEAAYHYIRLHYDKITAGAILRDPANQKELLNFYKSKMTPLDFRREGAEKTLSNPQHKLGKDIDAGRKSDEASRIRAKKAKDEFEKEWKAKQEKGVAEGERTMSRVAKGIMKYGKKGMKKLADMGREGAPEEKMDAARDELDRYNEEWSQKYKSSINCSHPKGFSQKAHCAGKKKHNENIEMEMVCEDCGMCQTHGNLHEIKKGQKDSNGYTSCWSGYHAAGTKKSSTTGKQVRNCVPNEGVAEGDEYNEYSDEVDMVKNNLLTIIRACKELANTMESGENLPEWVEEKVSMSKQNMVTVAQYLQSQHQQGHIYEKMMPSSMFAGSNKNKLGVAGQWRNKGPKKNKPAQAGDLVGGDESIQYEASDEYHQRLQWNLEAAVDERSVSQAQARTMAAAAHNPAFAKKVGIKTNVAQEFNRADVGKDISKLPVRVIRKK